MKLHHTKYKQNYKSYILDHIEEDYNGKPLNTDKQKIDFLFYRFFSEYGWQVGQLGKRKAMTEWLSGLAIPFACYNGEIIDLAIKMGSIDENPSDKLVNRVLEGYFPFMANIILDMKRDTSHQVTRDGDLLYVGSSNDCFEFLLNYQGNSCDHAMKHEGYAINNNFWEGGAI